MPDIIPPRTIKLRVGDSADLHKQHLHRIQYASSTPTGYHITKDSPVTIRYSTTNPNANVENTLPLEIRISDTDPFESSDPDAIIQIGQSATFTAPRSGVIYVGSFIPFSVARSHTYQISFEEGSAITPIPYFIFNPTYREEENHTQEDWTKMLDTYNTATSVVLIGRRNALHVSYSKAQEHITDPIALLTTLDRMADRAEDLYGIRRSRGPQPHVCSRIHYLHIEGRNPRTLGGESNAFDRRTAYDPAKLGELLNVEKLKNNIGSNVFGAFVEFGHIHNMTPLLWKADMIDVLAQLTSLYIQQYFQINSRLLRDNKWGAIMGYIDSSEKTFDNQDRWIRVAMFWQLFLNFGLEFYQKLGKAYREMTSLPNTDSEKRQTFLIESSKASGYNLLPFFKTWGISATTETEEAIRALSLKQLSSTGCLEGEAVPMWKKQDVDLSQPALEAELVSLQNYPGTLFANKDASSSQDSLVYDEAAQAGLRV